jgi:hypothetical protein
MMCLDPENTVLLYARPAFALMNVGEDAMYNVAHVLILLSAFLKFSVTLN